MSKSISLNEAAALLRGADDILILSHQFPDGDTLGCAAALCRGLQQLGKRAATACVDEPSAKYAFLFEGLACLSFEPKFVVTVDVATEELLGEPVREQYAGRVDLSIDHHGSHTPFAKAVFVDSTAAATAEVLYDLFKLLEVKLDLPMAEALFTALSTDTGCFKYPNTTPRTHRMAADLLELGVNAGEINHRMFDTKTRARMEMERMVLETLQFYLDGRCAMIYISREMIESTGAQEDDLDGLSSLPRQPEGVLAGVTIRQKKNGDFKLSLRTEPPIDAAKICGTFGGGGHANAAGATLSGTLEEIRSKVEQAVNQEFAHLG